MEIELHPQLLHKEHETLNIYLNDLLNHKTKNEHNILIEKTDYFIFYCEDGIYNIINDKLYKTDFYKNDLNKPLEFKVKHKNKYISTIFSVNYSTKKEPISNTPVSCLPFHHIVNKCTKYVLVTSKKSNTKCEIIFNNNKLVDIVFYLELPIYTVSTNIDTYICECIENTENNITNVYNETFYSLVSPIINML
jgi:hypothetical protein